jgi:hypothetical protein
MKNHFKYVMMGLTALVGAATLSGCSSNEEVDINPTYDPETGRVRAEFVFNVTQPGERTRQVSEVVGNGTFQGINEMYLFCFDAAPGNGSTLDGNHTFTLDDLGKPEPTHADGTPNSSKIYSIYIPTGTRNFLFYATANDASKSGKPGYYGKLHKAYAGNISSVNDITFNLVNRVEDIADFTSPQSTLLGILNGIVGVGISSPEVLSWSATGSSSNGELEALAQTYEKFVSQANEGDVRQGSATAIRNMVGDLFDVVNDIYSKTTNATAKALSEAILQKIGEYFTVTATGTPAVYAWGDSYVSAISSVVSDYPNSLGIPDGCAVLVFNDATGQFVYKNNEPTISKVSVDFDDVTYPAELTYYCNSGLWQSVQPKEAASYPTSAVDWMKAPAWTSEGWNSNAVSASTRAVAMKENITYGVSQLKATVQRNVENYFVDNASAISGGAVENNVFSGTSADGISFTVTGILIGGQPDIAQFEYLPKTTSFSKVIYDPVLADSNTELPASNNGKTLTNYTLALDNFTVGETQPKVYVALELMADKNFYGLSGYVKAGQKFYLIGELDPLSAQEPVDWTKQTSFESGDTGYGQDRVFIRDAITTATFTIGKTALQRAYSTIPDLRSTQMFFGLSVDLEWKAGLNFNVVID